MSRVIILIIRQYKQRSTQEDLSSLKISKRHKKYEQKLIEYIENDYIITSALRSATDSTRSQHLR